MAKGQPLPPGSPLQLRGLQRAGHSSNWAIARFLRATSPGRGQTNRNPANDSEKSMVPALGQL